MQIKCPSRYIQRGTYNDRQDEARATAEAKVQEPNGQRRIRVFRYGTSVVGALELRVMKKGYIVSHREVSCIWAPTGSGVTACGNTFAYVI